MYGTMPNPEAVRLLRKSEDLKEIGGFWLKASLVVWTIGLAAAPLSITESNPWPTVVFVSGAVILMTVALVLLTMSDRRDRQALRLLNRMQTPEQ